jgi:hypothetical protein
MDEAAVSSGAFDSASSAPLMSIRPSEMVTRRVRRIAFCGFWEGTRDLAPVDDPSFEIWGCNHGWPYLKKTKTGETRWDVWFDLHDPAWSAKNMSPDPAASAKVWAEQDAFLRTAHGRPIYMQRHYPEYPNSVAFPLAEIEARFPVTSNRSFRRYNTNALTYAISLALLNGVTDLAIYGADMRGDEEYESQRPAVEYWLGRAEGMGVRVIVPPESGLLNADGMDYGYDESGSALVDMRRAIVADLQRADEEKNKALATQQTYDGLIQGYRDIIRRIDQRRRGGGAF